MCQKTRSPYSLIHDNNSWPELGSLTDSDKKRDGLDPETAPPAGNLINTVENTLGKKQTSKLTLLDLFRNKRLLHNAMVMWTAW